MKRATRLVATALGFTVALAAPPAWTPARAFDVKRVDDSVVRVLAAAVKEIAGKLQGVQGQLGTGFVIDNEYVATNHHVVHISEAVAKIPGAQEYFAIRLPGEKKPLKAEVVWKSKELDLAVLKVPGLKRAPLTLADADAIQYPPKGAKVFALGYPQVSDDALASEEGTLTSTLTQGVVGKSVRAALGGKFRPVIQHDAAINPGNSGGPLFNNCNVVVGVNTFVALSSLQIIKDEEGNPIAKGATAAGISLSPHVSNLIGAVKSEQALRGLKLRLSAATDCADEAPASIPPWLYGVIGGFGVVAMAGVLLALTRRREVVRVVESYSAWVRRKGVDAGTPRTAGVKPPVRQMPAATSEPTELGTRMPTPRGRMETKGDAGAQAVPAAGDWVLSGFDTQGNTLRVAISPADLDKAMESPEKGIILGRSSSLSDKIVNDASVSRRHAKLSRAAEGGLQIEDLNSAYGTKVNDEVVAPFQTRPVAPGDKISMGAITLDLSQMP